MAAIEAATGVRPVGWNSRVPNADTRELLAEVGDFKYDSDTYGDDLPYVVTIKGQPWVTVPHTMDVTDERFWSIWQSSGYTNPENFFNAMKDAFDRLYEEGATNPKMMSVAMRPRISGRPSRAPQVDRFLSYVAGFPEVWIARRVDIAAWWREHGPGKMPASGGDAT